MRPWPSALALAALGLLLAALRPPGRPPEPPAPAPDGPQLVLHWPEPASDDPAAPWPGRFAVANRGATASGPVQLTIRTPVGIAHAADLAPELVPGASTSSALALLLDSGMTELCLEIRATPIAPARAELDLSDNRICRRPVRAGRLAHTTRRASQEIQP